MKAVLDIYLISDIASYDTFVGSDVYNAMLTSTMLTH